LKTARITLVAPSLLLFLFLSIISSVFLVNIVGISTARPLSDPKEELNTMGNQAGSAAGLTAVTTPPDRLLHYVLKTPLAPALVPPIRKAVFATGCYWGSEKSFWRMP